jgi:hypothetical protein
LTRQLVNICKKNFSYDIQADRQEKFVRLFFAVWGCLFTFVYRGDWLLPIVPLV